jgi:rhamnose utilization protein RhaD (predicted bifunctional aldolase and dehydrogenase)
VPPRTPVLVLGHHGLVVGGASVAEARALAAEVGRRLSRTPRPAPAPDLARLAALAAGSGYVLPADAASHATATDAASLAVARRGSLYPDHVIFLGPGVAVLGADETLADHTAPLLLVPEAGVLLRGGASGGAVALARCLADVTTRLDPEEDITVLGAADEAELAGWDAEKYRRTLDRTR